MKGCSTRLILHTVTSSFGRAVTAEMDEMWSFAGSKSQQRWLWHAIEHHTGQVFAYVFGTREDEVFLELKALLAPFGITRFYTDGWGAYRRHIDSDKHTVGKQHTQKIERKHTTLRARIKRLARKTICFSRSVLMHDLVIGLFILQIMIPAIALAIERDGTKRNQHVIDD